MMDDVFLAVNGTLMRGLSLNKNMLEVQATFIKESKTSPHYRLWSINDQYPGMMRDEGNGQAIEVEIWELSSEALVTILINEPPGLCIGRVELEGHENVFGVLAEPYIVEGQKEITNFGGWRKYQESKLET